MSDDIEFADPLSFEYEDDVRVEFLPRGKFFSTRGPDCVVFYHEDDCVHVDDEELAEFYRNKVQANDRQA